MAVANTAIYFPPSMVRLAATAIEETGGIMDFIKVPEVKTLRLDKTELVAGDPGSVEPNKLLHTHLTDHQWVLFHTHPARKPPHYMGLSGGDLNFIMSYALTAPGDIPKVSHILIAPNSVHYTILSSRPYALLRSMLKQYMKHREKEMNEEEKLNIDALDEFLSGMRYIFQIAESFTRVLGKEDDIVGMSVLDTMWFHPTDTITAFMLFGAPRRPGYRIRNETEAPFFDWFMNEIPSEMRTDYDSGALEETVDTTIKFLTPADRGLFYSWSLPKTRFLTEKGEGVMVLGDGGTVYDSYVESDTRVYNYLADIKVAMRSVGGSAVTPIVHKGGSAPVDVTQDMIERIAELARKDIEKNQIDDLTPHPEPPPIGSARKTTSSSRRRLPSAPTRKVRSSSSSSKKRRTRRLPSARSGRGGYLPTMTDRTS